MSSSENISTGPASARHVSHALAALREAAECLEDAAAASEQPVLNVASALSHVAAARTVLRPSLSAVSADTPERDAA